MCNFDQNALQQLFKMIDGTRDPNANCAKDLLQVLASKPRPRQFNQDPCCHDDVRILVELDMVQVEGNSIVLNNNHQLVKQLHS